MPRLGIPNVTVKSALTAAPNICPVSALTPEGKIQGEQCKNRNYHLITNYTVISPEALKRPLPNRASTYNGQRSLHHLPIIRRLSYGRTFMESKQALLKDTLAAALV